MTIPARAQLSVAIATPDRRTQIVRVASGAIFFVAGLPKFAMHSWEAGHFRTYGLPFPDAFTYLIGALEIVGGLALLAGLGTRAVAFVLGAIMVGAIVTSGIGQGEWIPSLTLAPALLAAMVYLLWAQSPPESAVGRLLRRRRAPR